MSNESPIERYLRLRKELEKKQSEEISEMSKRSTEMMKRATAELKQLSEAIMKEKLDEMEFAIRSGDLEKARCQEWMVREFIDLILLLQKTRSENKC